MAVVPYRCLLFFLEKSKVGGGGGAALARGFDDGVELFFARASRFALICSISFLSLFASASNELIDRPPVKGLLEVSTLFCEILRESSESRRSVASKNAFLRCSGIIGWDSSPFLRCSLATFRLSIACEMRSANLESTDQRKRQTKMCRTYLILGKYV